MRLKKFLDLVRTDEIINLYNPLENCYLQMEQIKGDIDQQYFNYKIVGVNTNYDSFSNSILEIDIINS